MGDPKSNLARAILELNNYDLKIKQCSSVYSTAPWGNTNQNDFLNQVVQVETKMSPTIVLETLQTIEKKMGRARKSKWGPRIIDIDLLYYNDQIINDSGLKVPHPEIPNRRFTLVPLCEIASEFIHPVRQKTQLQLLQDCQDDLKVIKITR